MCVPPQECFLSVLRSAFTRWLQACRARKESFTHIWTQLESIYEVLFESCRWIYGCFLRDSSQWPQKLCWELFHLTYSQESYRGCLWPQHSAVGEGSQMSQLWNSAMCPSARQTSLWLFLSSLMKKVKNVTQSYLTLWSMDCSPPGSSVHGILQARILEWVGILFSRGSSQPRDGTQVSCISGRVFTIWTTKEAPSFIAKMKQTKTPPSKQAQDLPAPGQFPDEVLQNPRVTSAVMASYASLSRCGQGLHVSSYVIFTSVQESPGVKVTSLPVLLVLLSLAGKLIHMRLNGPQATHKQTLCVCWALQSPYLEATIGSGLPVEQIPNEDFILIHSHKALSAVFSVFPYRLSFCFTPALPSWHPLLHSCIKLPKIP